MFKKILPFLAVAIVSIIFAFVIPALQQRYDTLALAAAVGIPFLLLVSIFLIKNPSVGALLILFFLPFERMPSVEVGGVNIRINHFLIGLTFLIWLCWMLAQRKMIFQKNPAALPILFFFLVNLATLLFARDLKRAAMVVVFLGFVILAHILIVNLIRSKELMRKAVLVLFLTSLIVSIFALYQFFGDLAGLPLSLTGLKSGYNKIVFGFPRPHAASLEPLYFANFLFIPLGLTLSYFFQNFKIIKRPWLFVLILLFLVVFVLTLSRGAYLGLAFFFLTFAIFQARKIFTVKNIIQFAAVAMIVSAAVYLFLSYSAPKALDEFLGHAKVEDFSRGESVVARLKAADSAFTAFRENSLLGIGAGNFGPYVKNYPNQIPPTGWPIVNNQYLETLAENGILGITFLMLIFIILFVRSIMAYFKTKDNFLKATMLGLMAAFVGVLAQFVTFSTIYILTIWVLMGLLVVTQNLIFAKAKNV